MSNRYGMSSFSNGDGDRNGHGNSNGYGNFGAPTMNDDNEVRENDYDPYGDSYGDPAPLPPPRGGRGGLEDRYGTSPQPSSPNPGLALRNKPSRTRIQESNAERQISKVLEHIKSEWPAMVSNDCIPAQLALQLLDSSSVGRAHDYQKFQETHEYLQDSLKGIVHEHHQGFNSAIGTFHKIQGSIQASQKRVRALKESLASSKSSLCSTDLELKKLSEVSTKHDELLSMLNELDDLRAVPDQLEARISEKRFLTAVEILQSALRKLRRPELDDIGGLNDLRSYLTNQETALMDILVEELHEHLYLKSPYCQERWQSLSKSRGSHAEGHSNTQALVPFYAVLDAIETDHAVTEDPMKNPEADTFYYVGLLVESLNKLGRLQNAVETLKQRMPVELFGVVNETINEVDQRHPSSLRGSTAKPEGLHIYSSRETQMRADVIYDLLWTLYAKFESIGEGHRVFHENIKALLKREGAGPNSALLGSFKELWNLYQNEIRSLLHNYVTTDADVYQFDTPTASALNGKKDAQREHLFKFSEANSKSVSMTAEYDALEDIIRNSVPGLTDSTRKHGAESKRERLTVDAGSTGRRGQDLGYANDTQNEGSYKSLVEPSVFNMSLLLPPTLGFLQRLKSIVPPGSDLATSTLTSFLDNFLINVFQPQLDESLAKLGDSVLGEADSFLQDQSWKQHARRPVFKGTTTFFEVVRAFCRMLGTIPPDQALSSLIVTQMMRYYDRCFVWYKSLVTKTQDQTNAIPKLRASARFAVEEGEVHEVMKQIWTAENVDRELYEKEIHLLMEQTNQSKLEMSDIIQDRDTITSLCLLYTSMKWLAVKISGLRYITTHETDTSRHSLPRQSDKRWSLLEDHTNAIPESGPVRLPLTQDTVQSFDSIVSSFEELAATALLTLHIEVRCRVVHSLRIALSPGVAPYLLDHEVSEPDHQILNLNAELASLDETVVRFLRDREIGFFRNGIGLLINNYLVANAWMASPMNEKGCGRMQLNILVLQQNLKNVEDDVELARASNYYSLFEKGPDAIVTKAKEVKEAESGIEPPDPTDTFSYEELKTLTELCYSERVSNKERGISSAARRLMEEKLEELRSAMEKI